MASPRRRRWAQAKIKEIIAKRYATPDEVDEIVVIDEEVISDKIEISEQRKLENELSEKGIEFEVVAGEEPEQGVEFELQVGEDDPETLNKARMKALREKKKKKNET